MDTTIVTGRLLAAHIPQCKPTKEDDKFTHDAMAYLVVKHPFFAHLLYNEMRIVHTDAIDTAATDGRTIFLNVPGLRAIGFNTIARMAFVIAHEIAHCFLGDMLMNLKWTKDECVITPKGKLPYVHMLMNIAEDYRINAMLIEAKVGEYPPNSGCYDVNYSQKGMESGVEIYARLWKDGYSLKVGKGSGNGGLGTPFDIHLTPDSKAEKEAATGKREQAIAAAAEAARASGKGDLPAAIRQIIGEILEPKVAWQDHLKATMQRKAGDPSYDWRYIDRRMMVRPDPVYFAKQSHTGAGTIVIGYDTSGSCVSPAIQQLFFSEMAGIVAELNPSQLVIIWCDASVQRVDDIDDPEDLLDLHRQINELGGAPGGGGTSFKPVFERVEELELQPDMLVYLTDTYGDFPAHEPDYPTIWCSIVPKPRVPWGDVVEVEL